MPELTDLTVEEISLVGKAANGQRFILYKSDEGGGTLVEMQNEEARKAFEDALNGEIDGEAGLIGKAGNLLKADLSNTTENELRGGLRLLAAARGELGDEVVKGVLAEAGYVPAPAAAPVAKPETKPAPTKAAPPTPEIDATVPDEVMAVAKAAGPDDGAQILARYREDPKGAAVWFPMLKAQAEEIADLRKSEKERADREDAEACRKAAEDLGIPGDRATQEKFLKGLSLDQRKALADYLKPAQAQLEKADRLLLGELGTSRRGAEGGDTAYEIAMEKARALVAKGDGKLSETDALVQVFQAEPDLHRRHRAETLKGGA
jgi:hypothetical protein